MKTQWNILITLSWLHDLKNDEIFKTIDGNTVEYSGRRIITGWHGEQQDFQNKKKTMEHFDQDNGNTVKYSDHWIMTGWHGEHRDFPNNLWKQNGIFWSLHGSWLDDMRNCKIFKTKKRQWNILINNINGNTMEILITGLCLENSENYSNEKKMENSDHWVMTGWHGKQQNF